MLYDRKWERSPRPWWWRYVIVGILVAMVMWPFVATGLYGLVEPPNDPNRGVNVLDMARKRENGRSP